MDLPISTISYITGELKYELNDIRNDIAKIFNTKEALKWEVHTTIAQKVFIPEKEMEKVLRKISTAINNTKVFTVKTTGFQFIKLDYVLGREPYTIRLGIEKSKQLEDFHNSIAEEAYSGLKVSGNKLEYIPYITMAYRDLTKEDWEAAKDCLKDNKGEHQFEINNLNLIYDDSQILKPYKEFRL